MISFCTMNFTDFLKRCILLAVVLFLPFQPQAQENGIKKDPAAERRVLIFSKAGWYRHPETPAINGFLVQLLSTNHFQAHVTETPEDLTPAFLKQFKVLLLNNANHLGEVFNEKQQKAVTDWYRAGGGIVSLHAASVQHGKWPWLIELTGCDFDSDSEFTRAKILVEPSMKNHPTVKGSESEFWYEADWHNYTKSVTGLPGVQVLLRIDESTYEPVRAYFKERGGKAMGKDHPVAWLREAEGSRLFYTCLGHDVRSLDTPFGRKHVLEGVRWAARDY
jgi:uncharacterized protein